MRNFALRGGCGRGGLHDNRSVLLGHAVQVMSGTHHLTNASCLPLAPWEMSAKNALTLVALAAMSTAVVPGLRMTVSTDPAERVSNPEEKSHRSVQTEAGCEANEGHRMVAWRAGTVLPQKSNPTPTWYTEGLRVTRAATGAPPRAGLTPWASVFTKSFL